MNSYLCAVLFILFKNPVVQSFCDLPSMKGIVKSPCFLRLSASHVLSPVPDAQRGKWGSFIPGLWQPVETAEMAGMSGVGWMFWAGDWWFRAFCPF